MSRLGAKTRLFVSVALAVFVLATPQAHAATTPAPPKGITIAPFLQTVTLAEIEKTKQIEVKVTNQTASKRFFTVTTANFGSLNETGGIAFLGQDSDKAGDHGLRDWLELDREALTLNPGESVTLHAIVRNDETLAPGGHYGAVLVNEVTKEGSGQAKVSTNPTVSALLFVDKLGGETHDLHLDSLRYDTLPSQLPSNIILRFQNPGNTEAIPRGTVQIFRGKDTLVKKGIINEDSGIALPGTFRQIAVPLKKVGSAGWLPQRYRIEVVYRYDGTDQTALKTEQVFAVPLSFVAAILSLLGLATFAGLNRRRIVRLLRR